MFTFKIDKSIIETFREMGYSRRVWGSNVIKHYQDAVDVIFKTGGLGRWRALRPGTVHSRQHRHAKYYREKTPESTTTFAYPPNTWSGALRDAVAGRRQRTFRARNVGANIEDFTVRTRIEHAKYALARRPMDNVLRAWITAYMNDQIVKEVNKNIRGVSRKGRR